MFGQWHQCFNAAATVNPTNVQGAVKGSEWPMLSRFSWRAARAFTQDAAQALGCRLVVQYITYSP